MTMAVPIPQGDVVPPCFGLEWNPREPECTGGPDANFQDGSGGHIRDQCAVFARCGARTQALRQSRQTSNVIPPGNLVRPPMVTPPPAQHQHPPRSFKEYLERQGSNYVEQQRVAALQGPRPPVSAPVQTQSPTFQHTYPSQAHYPAARYELNYTAPEFLTVPEERGEGDTFLSVLIRELIRAAAKALGLAFASAFDRRVLKDHNRK
jgi:hypothetical protein